MSAPKVYSAICAVMEEIGRTGISKDRKNTQQGYSFRGIDDVYNELNSLLSKHALVMLPSVISSERDERQTQRGGALFYTRLTIDFKLVSAEDGSSDTIRTVGEAMDSADKSSNKAQSAAYKYAAMMVFCIPTEGDNDADAVTHEVAHEPVERLPKKDARDIYSKLEKTMRQCTTRAELREWIALPVTRKARASMPADWDQRLKDSAAEFGKDLPEGHVSPEDIFPGDIPMDAANNPQIQ